MLIGSFRNSTTLLYTDYTLVFISTKALFQKSLKKSTKFYFFFHYFIRLFGNAYRYMRTAKYTDLLIGGQVSTSL